jgi:gluconolactonase
MRTRFPIYHLASAFTVAATCVGAQLGCSSDPAPVEPAADAAVRPDANIPADAGRLDAAQADSSTPLDAQADGPLVYPNPITGIGAPTLLPGAYQFTEGPLWFEGKLIFSDVPASKIYQWIPGAAATTIFRDPSGGANGNAVGPDGALYTCEHGGKRVSKTLNGTVSGLISRFNNLAFNSPNDVIVRRDGTVYFTDPNYAGNTQPKQSVFRVTPQGALSVVDDTLEKPNGIALSPDQKLLYVTSASGGFINLYDVAADGSTSNKRKFVDVAGPDGIAVDDAGNVYVASAKVEVFNSAGTNLGSITLPMRPSNVAFGGVNQKTVFITAQTSVYQVNVNVPGQP